MKQTDIVIISDAWKPQINGVVRTLDAVRHHLTAMGREVAMVTPEQFLTIPCPTYPEIRLSINAWPKLANIMDRLAPIHVHISTEGPLGIAARHYCRRHGLRFTTAFHTKFPEYLAKRFTIPPRWMYERLRKFHAASSAVLVPTPSMQRELEGYGFTNTQLWTRGVDTALFRPLAGDLPILNLPRPIWLNVGRVSVEKNLHAFLSLDLPGTKVVVGDGPMLPQLHREFPDAVFTGLKHDKELRYYYANSDVFVFPSQSDTYGLVMLEALACGTPVAAYPVTGPCDVIRDTAIGVLHEDLHVAALRALSLSREDCVRYAQQFSWDACAQAFAGYLCPNPPSAKLLLGRLEPVG